MKPRHNGLKHASGICCSGVIIEMFRNDFLADRDLERDASIREPGTACSIVGLQGKPAMKFIPEKSMRLQISRPTPCLQCFQGACVCIPNSQKERLTESTEARTMVLHSCSTVVLPTMSFEARGGTRRKHESHTGPGIAGEARILTSPLCDLAHYFGMAGCCKRLPTTQTLEIQARQLFSSRLLSEPFCRSLHNPILARHSCNKNSALLGTTFGAESPIQDKGPERILCGEVLAEGFFDLSSLVGSKSGKVRATNQKKWPSEGLTTP